MLLRQIDPRHVQRNSCLLRIALQIRLQRTIFRLCPRFNRSLGQSLQLVGNHEIEIEINRVPKSLAARASAIRIVEGKQPRLRLLIPQVAELTFKSLRKAQGLWRLHAPGRVSRLLPVIWDLKNNLAASR